MLLSAYAPASGIVVAQREIPAKTNEIPEVPDLLATVALVGKVVTADALHTQDATARHLRKRGAYYVLTVKANRPKPLAAIKERFADPEQVTDTSCEIERGHGVYRIRRIETVDAAGLPFPGAALAARITRYTCDLATGLPTGKEVVHIITSLPPRRAGAAKIAGYVRAHWAVENQVHYLRDVALREDACRHRQPPTRPGRPAQPRHRRPAHGRMDQHSLRPAQTCPQPAPHPRSPPPHQSGYLGQLSFLRKP
jgi:predicted transposase YbfD/YdcC